MKKVLFASIFACIAFSTVDVNAQTAKGDKWLGGSSDLDLTFTPEFEFMTALNADYFLMDRLSVGANVNIRLSSLPYVGLSPRVQYFVTKSVYTNVQVNVFSINHIGTSVGLRNLEVGVGYWHPLSNNVAVSPKLYMNDLSGQLAIGTSVGLQVKL